MTFPVAQVADNEAVALLQIVGEFVEVGVVGVAFTVTETATKSLLQLPDSQRTL